MNALLHKNKHKDGFTIVELLVVIVVIAILASISIVSYSGIQNRARNVAAQATLKQVSQQLGVYTTINGSVPGSLEEAGVTVADGDTELSYQTTQGGWCVAATGGDKSFYATRTNGAAREGTCLYESKLTETTTPTVFSGAKTIIFVGRTTTTSPHYLFDYRPGTGEFAYKNANGQTTTANVANASSRTTMKIEGDYITSYTTSAPGSAYIGQRYSQNEYWPGSWKAVSFSNSLSQAEIETVVTQLKSEI